MNLLAFLLIFPLLFSTFSQRTGCVCKPVAPEQVPLGGNETITQTVPKPVKSVHGVVLFWVNEKPVDKAIVEVFDYPVRRKRRAACMTGADGKFCFARLPAGMYELRVGTSNRNVDYFNYVFVRVTVSPKTRKASNKEIRVELTAAT
jgi:hypothetical protein